MSQPGSNKSWFAYFIWDKAVAGLTRLMGSSNAGVAAAGKASLDTLQTTAKNVGADLSAGLTANSAIAMKNDVVKGLEDTLKAGVDAYLIAAVPLGLGPEAAVLANTGLDFVEEHAVDYVRSLFAHARAQLPAASTPTSPATAPPQPQI